MTSLSRSRLLGVILLAAAPLISCGAPSRPPVTLTVLAPSGGPYRPEAPPIPVSAPPPPTPAASTRPAARPEPPRPARTPTTRASRSERRPTATPTTTALAPVAPEPAGTMSRLQRRIGGCESGGKPDAELAPTRMNRQGSGAGGAWQVMPTTWRGWVKRYALGTGAARYDRAEHAPLEVQAAVVAEVLAHEGTGPWKSSRPCWSG